MFLSGPFKVKKKGIIYWILPPVYSTQLPDGKEFHWKTVLEYAAEQLLGFECDGDGVYHLDKPLTSPQEIEENPLWVHRATYRSKE